MPLNHFWIAFYIYCSPCMVTLIRKIIIYKNLYMMGETANARTCIMHSGFRGLIKVYMALPTKMCCKRKEDPQSNTNEKCEWVKKWKEENGKVGYNSGSGGDSWDELTLYYRDVGIGDSKAG